MNNVFEWFTESQGESFARMRRLLKKPGTVLGSDVPTKVVDFLPLGFVCGPPNVE